MNNALLAPYSSLILASIQCLPVNDKRCKRNNRKFENYDAKQQENNRG